MGALSRTSSPCEVAGALAIFSKRLWQAAGVALALYAVCV